MKLVTICLMSLMTSSLCAQTNIISNRSHSGDLAEVHLEKDNFGMPAMEIDSIIYNGENCIIEVRSYGFSSGLMRDTVCDHPYFVENGYNLSVIRKLYPQSTVFVGFKEEIELTPSPNGWPIQNGLPWIIGLIAASVLGYTFAPSRKG